jgi:tetrahydromethanopterin S-methyltransferase subunit G
MRRITVLFLCCLAVVGTGFATVGRADEQQANELRARAEEIRRDVQQLHEQGKHEAAEQREREAVQLREKAEQVAREGRPESDRMHELAQHLRELSQQWLDATVDERRDAVERIEKEIHEIARDTGARIHEIMQPAMETIERKMVELREQGRPEMAERIGARVREMMAAHRRAEEERGRAEQSQQQVQEQRERAVREERQRNQERIEVARQRLVEIEKRVEQLRREGKGEQADRLMERIANAKRDMGIPRPQQDRPQQDRPQQDRPQQDRPQPPEQGPKDRGAMEQRMQHLRVAAEHLHQVGMHDLAEKLNGEAEDIQRALQGPPPGDDPHRGTMEAIQQEFRKVHERLDEINRRLDELSNRMPQGR